MFRAISLPRPSDRWMRLLLAPALIFIATAINRNYQTDLWHHLARGRAIAEQGSLVNNDLFTFTVPGRPFQDANWGSQLVFYFLYRAGGLTLVQAVNSLTLAAMMAVLVGLAWRRSGSLAVACGVCIFAFFGLWQLLIIRPQTFSLLLFVLIYAALEGAERRRWLLAIPPVLMALWVNLHGGFPIGFGLIGCYLLAAFVRVCWRLHSGQTEGRTFRQEVGPWALCLAASVVATLANPYGWKVYQYVKLTAGVASSRGIEEWLPPGSDLLVSKVWVVSLVGLLLLFALARQRPAVREVCLVCCFLPLTCGAVRMIAWWLLVLAPILATQLAVLLPASGKATGEDRPSVAAGVVCALLVLAMAFSLPCFDSFNPFMQQPGKGHRTESDLQDVAERLAEASPSGRVFTRFEWGEYLTWALAPNFKVFMDGRIEIFPDDTWAEYAAVTRGRGDWEAILAGYDVEWLLLDVTHHGDLLPLVRRSTGWKETYHQGNAVLFARQRPDARQIVAR
jgi:hypothetical protein